MHPIKTSGTIIVLILFAVIIGMQNSVLILNKNPVSQNAVLIDSKQLKTNQPFVIAITLSDLFRKPPKTPRSVRQKNMPRTSDISSK
jgi:hypothetical protein